MDNGTPTLECHNFNCLASNPLTEKFCHKCGSPLVRRYLWMIGDSGCIDGQENILLQERYLVKQSRIVLDTKPALAVHTPEDIPTWITPYLKLFPYRLHVPQIYDRIIKPNESEESSPQEIWLLEYGTIPLQASGELLYPNLLPKLTEVWSEATGIRQLNWLWQFVRMWQPLQTQKVVASLLNPELIGVNGRLIQLLELELDNGREFHLKDLVAFWEQLKEQAHPHVSKFLEQICEHLKQEIISRPEQLVMLFEQALKQWESSQQRIYEVFSCTDTGPRRDHNEDACYPFPNELYKIEVGEVPLAIVCDGIGGQEGGEIASSLAIERLKQEVYDLQAHPTNGSPYTELLAQAVRQANNEIAQRNDHENRYDRQRMGTTVVLGVGLGHEMYTAHIGDSRIYWITPNSCHQITVDDDLASREVRLGYLLYRDAIQYPNSGALVQALGMNHGSNLYPTVQRFILDEDSLFLLCSDGLSDYDRIEQFWYSELTPILRGEKSLVEVGQRLVKIANEKNGHDNVTIALIYSQVGQVQEQNLTPLLVAELESSVSSLGGPTILETIDEFDNGEDTQADVPTVLSVPKDPEDKHHPRKLSNNFLLLMLLLVALAIGGFLYYSNSNHFNPPRESNQSGE